MKQRNIRFIIGLMAIALLGVVAMQYYFIRESFRLKSQLFDQAVNEVLNVVSKKIEKRDAIMFLKHKASGHLTLQNLNYLVKQAHLPARVIRRKGVRNFSKYTELKRKKNYQSLHLRDSLLRLLYPKALIIDNDFFETYLKNPSDIEKVRISVKQKHVVGPEGATYQDEVRELYVDDTDQKKLVKAKDDSIRYLVEDPTLGLTIITLPDVDTQSKDHPTKADEEQIKKVNRYIDSIKTVKRKIAVFEDLAKELSNVPLKDRIDKRFVDSLIRNELLSQGIDLPYTYKLDVVALGVKDLSGKEKKLVDRSVYAVILFPGELVRESGLLTLNFSNKTGFLMRGMNVILISSAGLLLTLISCFAYTMIIILRQKKLSQMKTDFINNMTHEFKTPVSTIMIASEALKDPEITKDKKRLNRLVDMIYDENKRLGSHIERVLNIAKMEEGDIALQNKEVEMNKLLTTVVDSMSLQLQKNEAIMQLHLDAKNAVIMGDELHLSNVIFNLVDNAAKYSVGAPHITIRTYNEGNKLVIKIADRGIGMGKEQLSKIFDQFYRIPTGNIHNVKGFGLGLSYVYNIVKRLRGTISVKSEKGKGSEFEISFTIV
ncbi:MAG: HAMP domain-containing sensor histidine kinase [Sphingobacteriaceae bacterium]|nr:MAG: HAMP domain-containing histidine kinase [Pedobacter sp.]